MKYFEELDVWLDGVLMPMPDEEDDGSEWFARVKKQLKNKVLESYRNGQKAGLPKNAAKAEGSAKDKPREPEARTRRQWVPRRSSQRS